MGKILNSLPKLLIPTCIPELVILSTLFPVLTLNLLVPLLVIPTMMGVLVVSKLFSRAKMEACQVSFQRSYLFVKIPEVDVLYMKPTKLRLEENGTLTVSSRFSSLSLRFRDKRDCRTLCEKIR